MSEEATINISRVSNYPWYIKYKGAEIFHAYLDGRHIGNLSWDPANSFQNDIKTFVVPVGQHSLVIKGLIWRTETLNFHISAGDKKFFECSRVNRGSRQLLFVLAFLLAFLPIVLFRYYELWPSLIFSLVSIYLLILHLKPGGNWSLKEV